MQVALFAVGKRISKVQRFCACTVLLRQFPPGFRTYFLRIVHDGRFQHGIQDGNVKLLIAHRRVGVIQIFLRKRRQVRITFLFFLCPEKQLF